MDLDAAHLAEVGRYRLLRLLGQGAMGKVDEAEDATTERHVAVKLIRTRTASPDAVERFRHEGRLASALSNPRCVFVLAAEEEDGQPYIVMELMPGDTLQDLLKCEGPPSVEQAGFLTTWMIVWKPPDPSWQPVVAPRRFAGVSRAVYDANSSSQSKRTCTQSEGRPNRPQSPSASRAAGVASNTSCSDRNSPFAHATSFLNSASKESSVS